MRISNYIIQLMVSNCVFWGRFIYWPHRQLRRLTILAVLTSISLGCLLMAGFSQAQTEDIYDDSRSLSVPQMGPTGSVPQMGSTGVYNSTLYGYPPSYSSFHTEEEKRWLNV